MREIDEKKIEALVWGLAMVAIVCLLVYRGIFASLH